MAVYDGIKIRTTDTTYPEAFQESYVGASATNKERGWWGEVPTISSGNVYAYLRVGPYLYFVGTFTSVGGETRNRAACLDLRDGSLTDWNPNADGAIQAIATDGTYIYLGGAFSNVGGVAYNKLVRVDITDGTVDSNWNPNMGGTVLGLYIYGTGVYAVGSFTTVNGGTARNYAAKFLTTDATVQAGFNVNANSSIYALDIDEDNEIAYLAGNFTTLDGGTGRNYAGAWDISATDALASFNPDANGACWSVKVVGENIWYGGVFTTVNTGTAATLAAGFNSGGVLISPDLSMTGGGTIVRAIEADENEEYIYLGGDFTGILSATRNRLAKIRTDDFTLEQWDPNANAVIYFLYRFQKTVYAGGAFTTINSVAAVSSKAVWDPFFTDSNAIWVSKTSGDDANAGTEAAPLKTLDKAQASTRSLVDGSGSGYTLTEVGTLPYLSRYHVTLPADGNYEAGGFSDSNYLTAPAGLLTAMNGLTDFTIEFTFMLKTLPTLTCLMRFDDTGQNAFYVTSGGAIQFYVNGTSLQTANGTVEVNKRYYAAFSFSSGTSGGKRILLGKDPDGMSDAVAAATQTHTPGAITTFAIGRDNAVASRAVDGYMGLVRVSNSALSTGFPSSATAASTLASYDFETAPTFDGMAYIVIGDSATYRERFETRFPYTQPSFRGLYAAPGYAPTLKLDRGPDFDNVGARANGRVKFSTGAAGTFYHVSKDGDDSTGTRGDSTLPFKTIQAALDDGARVGDDTIQIEDNGTYNELLNVGATDVTIQAADGKTPVIIGETTVYSTKVITGTSGVVIRIYGMTIRTTTKATATGYSVFVDDDFELYDCTISSTGVALDATASTTKTAVIENCHIKSSVNISRYDMTVHNSFVDSTFTSTVSDASFTDNKISNSQFQIQSSFGAANGSIVVTGCVFDDIFTNLILLENNGSYLGYTVYADNCVYGKNPATAGTAQPVAAWSTLYGDLVARSCGFYNGGILLGSARCLIKDSYSIDATNDGIAFSTTTHLFCNNCASLNSGRYGFEFGTPTNDYIFHLAEKGSGTASANHTSGATIVDSIYETATSVPTTNSVNADPLFISAVSGSENLALSGDSRGLNIGLTYPGSAGIAGFLVTISQENTTVNGLNLTGEVNSNGGVETDDRQKIKTFEYCSITEAGNFAAQLGAETRAKKNKVTGSNGSGLYMYWAGNEVQYNSVSGGAAVSFVNGFLNNVIENNSCEGGEYGQLDTSGVLAESQKNNVYSGSGSNDYSGTGTQTYSDVETLSDEAEVDANSTRKNPLYRNVNSNDLRLQAIAAGYVFDSPALAGGDDGKDMGAFPFYYGDALDTQTTLDFDTSTYRNPDEVEREHVHVRLVEDVREDASARSKSIGTKTIWRLKWGEANDMPEAQRTALQALYDRADSEMEISFDGGSTWTTVILLRQDAFAYQEIGKKYTRDDMPMPIKSLTFREK